MQSDHFVEVMASLNAIVRCFNDNIGNVDMNKLGQPVVSAHSLTALTMSTMDAEKV